MLKHLIVSALILFCISCDSHSHSHDEKGHAHPPETIKKNLKLEATLTRGSLQVVRALQSGFGEAVRSQRLKLVKNPTSRKAFVTSDSKVLSIAFSGNVKGERIDCGCRKNPLGGLARHQTLISEIDKESKLWEFPPNETLLSVDAGDVFFKNIFDDVIVEKGETPALYHAKSVASARKLMQVDVQNIGELDLVFGLDSLKELLKISEKKVVSANLYKDGKRIFEPFQIIEKGNMKIAVLGLIKEKSRKNDFFKLRNIESRNALAEFDKVSATLPEVDLVVLLSNLGVPNTRKLIADSKRPPHIVIVSNTNRLTREPLFEKGVPMLEPGTRGKHFGRADLILNGNEVSFANGGETKISKLDAYARTHRNYLTARMRYLRQIEKAQRSALDPAADPEHSKTDHLHSKNTHEHKKDPKKFMENAKVLRERMTGLADLLSSQAASLNVETSNGDDYIETKMAEVKLDIDGEKTIKTFITKREKKAPKIKKGSLPKR